MNYKTGAVEKDGWKRNAEKWSLPGRKLLRQRPSMFLLRGVESDIRENVLKLLEIYRERDKAGLAPGRIQSTCRSIRG